MRGKIEEILENERMDTHKSVTREVQERVTQEVQERVTHEVWDSLT